MLSILRRTFFKWNLNQVLVKNRIGKYSFILFIEVKSKKWLNFAFEFLDVLCLSLGLFSEKLVQSICIFPFNMHATLISDHHIDNLIVNVLDKVHHFIFRSWIILFHFFETNYLCSFENNQFLLGPRQRGDLKILFSSLLNNLIQHLQLFRVLRRQRCLFAGTLLIWCEWCWTGFSLARRSINYYFEWIGGFWFRL